MLASSNLVFSNFSLLLSLPFNKTLIPYAGKSVYHLNNASESSNFFGPKMKSPIMLIEKKGVIQISCTSKGTQSFEDPEIEKNGSADKVVSSTGNGSGEGRRDWTTSIMLFLFWAAVIYYVFNFSPNQTPSRDMYFLEKLLNLKGDDGFRMNEVLVSLWYIMGLWPVAYSMLLLPTGRSSKNNIPVWPFLVLSFFGGAYALLPYFIIWRPPPPPVEEGELRRWPLNLLESKITAGVLCAAGLGLIIYSGFHIGDWKEFYQYFRESKLVHVTCLDFSLLSAFAPFWVYNDMTSRKCYEKYSWLLPLSVIPFLGPATYLLLRPSPPTEAVPLKTSGKTE
ncbi:hypothetical protein Nepgr_014401 [Nepenthes gracilis]|uniref:Cardiolipin synthase N-terminal domain-containing protein n=1 Tax=Nepenthes gracilis TaxID=150966 RepID=A0AAD3SJ35_NEPGR|nr:hypothetical protein Nepgr_014401 [Nepenthes gracilis]